MTEDELLSAGIRLNSSGDKYEFLDDQVISVNKTNFDFTINLCDGDVVETNKDIADTMKVYEKTIETRSNGRKSKQRKKKLRKRSLSNLDDSNSVKFGTIEQILFTQTIGYDKIPQSGGYPISLGVEIHRNTFQIPSKDEQIPIQRSSTTKYHDKSVKHSQIESSISSVEKLKPISEASRKNLIADNHDSLQQAYVNDINHEITTIQFCRLKTGCSCKPVKVDKLSASKMRQMLADDFDDTVAQDYENIPKAGLIALIKDKLKNCEICITNKCECVTLEVPCNSEVCSCMRGGRKNHSQVCGNPNGHEAFDNEDIHSFRQKFLSSLQDSKIVTISGVSS